MTRPRTSHVLLIVLGLLMSVVMLAVLIPRVSHLGLHPTNKPAGVPAPALAGTAGRQVHHGWLTFGHVLLLFGVSGLLSAISLAGWVVYLVRRRLGNRLSREYGLYEVKLSMHDQAKPQDLIDMIEALGNATREFPEERSRDGQPFIALEAHYGPGQSGEPEWVLCIRCEKTLVCTVDGIISGAYPDIRVGYEFIGPPREITGVIPTPGHVLRYRKERSFVYPIVNDTERASSCPLEAIAQAQVALGIPSTVRFQLVPCALSVERLARERFRRHESNLARRESRPSTSSAGLMGTLNRAEMTAASESQDHSWFWLEVQVAVAGSRESANRVSAALQARRGENRLKRRWMILREDLYRQRFPTAYPPLLPSPSLRTLVSASDIAHLVELPGARMKGVPVRRLALPRVPAPPEVGFARDDPQPELPPPQNATPDGGP